MYNSFRNGQLREVEQSLKIFQNYFLRCQESQALPQVTLGLMRPLAIGEPDVKGEFATVSLSLLIFAVLWYAKCK